MDKTRQYAPTLEGIRPDHVNRYLFAAERIPHGSRVADVACGCGYGSWILKKSGHEVTGIDIEPEAIAYAEEHYKGPLYLCQRAEQTRGEYDALVSFETLEHLSKPEVVLNSIKAKLVIASVPNEVLYPFSAHRFAGDKYPHLRHYTPEQFDELLTDCGLNVTERFCQQSKQGKVVPGTQGIFLIYVCQRLP